MITKKVFKQIDDNVKVAVKKAFECAKSNEKNKNDYILFLCNAQYRELYENSNVNPYQIDYRIDKRYDKERLEFLMDYLNSNYSFRENESKDTHHSITIELMLYTHIWEAKPFLKQLKKLADICNSKDYNWNIQVPDSSKHDFIRTEIRDVFKSHNLLIHEIMTNSYHSSLRNAFAHSEYSFNMYTSEIKLNNYKGKDWEIKELIFDEWTKRFCNSFLLTFYFLNTFHEERTNLNQGEPGYSVLLKNKTGENKNGLLIYDRGRDAFRGNIIEK